MNQSTVLNAGDETKVRTLMREARAAGGLAPVDVEKFWADDKVARADPFGPGIPQVAFGASCTAECVFDELGVPFDLGRYSSDEPRRLALNKAYNDKAERIVGRRLLPEQAADPTGQYPAVKGLHDVFEARNVWHDNSWWLERSAHDPEELRALLDRVEARDVRRFILPENWAEEKARLMARGIRPPLYRSQRGPVTFAMSVYGVENLIYLILDRPDLAARFRDAILRTMLKIGSVTDAEAGWDGTTKRGFAFADDNCAMLTPEMYKFFGYPVLKGVFGRYAPGPDDRRHQHSDSDMGRLLPILGSLDFTEVNFGPTLSVRDIRRHCPRAVIYGQLAPFTYSRNEEENMVREFLRDFEQAREKRGLVFACAGSVNNGSRLTGMRLLMAAVQRFGRYS